MPVAAMVSFSSPRLGIAALALAIFIAGIAIWRRINLPGLSAILLAAGVLSLAIAAGEPILHRPISQTIAVMVDLSPSTRGARFRNSDFLRERVQELIGDSPHQFIAFADHNVAIDPVGTLQETPCDQTQFSPATADAIILFSDARFDLPKISPPVYIAADENLENPADASVEQLKLRGGVLEATIANSGSPRQASILGTTEPTTVKIDAGNLAIAQPISKGKTAAGVELNSGDLWPENDSLSISIAPPSASEKWWIGENPPASNWKHFSPESLPNLARDYLAPAVIVVQNQPADHFSPSQSDCLMQYVRDLGGSLLIVGGDHAFAAGAYPGTPLEQLSPLSSSPPDPTTRWILLVDGSGSMSQDAGGGISRWQTATQAVIYLLPSLPPQDPVQVGQFSDVLRWWTTGTIAAEAARIPLPPPDAFPHGPTNLESALNQIANTTDAKLPTELLLLSDCDTTFDHPNELANLLSRKKVRLYVLAIGQSRGLEVIRQISTPSGGQVVEQLDPVKWAGSIEKLFQSALPSRVAHEPATVVYENEAKSLPSENIEVWNRTWLKPQAERWAAAMRNGIKLPMAGFWRFGGGSIAAIAYEPAGSRIESLAEMIASKPRDPRFPVRWETGRRVHVIVDAIDNGRFLNDLPISLARMDDSGVNKSQLEQSGPGRYEVTFDAPRNPQIATLQIGDETIDRTSLPGRYPPEFDAIGNNHTAMQKLADKSGGEIIWPTDHGRINFHRPQNQIPLAPWFCASSLLLIGGGLIRWRLV